MSINPEHLLSFARVAETGSVSTAAESLFRSQPAVSQHLRQLTDAIGEPLYTRHRSGVQLTKTGLELLPHAQALERAIAGAQRVAEQVRGFDLGQLSVGASMTIAVYLMPRFLAAFKQLHPHLGMRLLTRNSTEVLDLLGHGDIEVALVETPLETSRPDIESRTLLHDEVVLAVTPDHPFATARGLRPRDLAGLEVVSREEGSGTRIVSELALASFGVEVSVQIETSGIEAHKEAILQGLGPGFISRRAIERELNAGLLSVVSVDGLVMSRPLTLLHLPLELCTRPSREFLRFLQTEAMAGG